MHWTAGFRASLILCVTGPPPVMCIISVKTSHKAFWLSLSPVTCVLVGMAYRQLNEHCVVRWWVHCKHCVIGEAPSFDANDFTLIFFMCLCLLTTAPLFFVFKQRGWPFMLGAFAINAFVCFYFMSRNIWA